jgi:citrate lyase subunit beta/citryl-CoA lyase
MPWHHADVAALVGCRGLRGVVVPKVESAADVALVRELLAVPVAALIETARGAERVAEVVALDGVERLLLGTVDLATDLACDEDSEVVAQIRCRLVTASRAAGRPAPVDGVTRTLRDTELVLAEARRSRRDGFAGKLAVHPAQVGPIQEAFLPSWDEVAWARQVVESAADDAHGALATAGDLVDAPVLARAQRILDHHTSGESD